MTAFVPMNIGSTDIQFDSSPSQGLSTMLLERFSPSLLTNTELPAVSERISDAVGRALPENTHVQQLLSVLAADIENLEAALSRRRISSFTEQISQLDEARDDAFIGLRDYAKASTRRSNQQVADAATVILEMIQERGVNLHRLGYSDQTTELNILFDNLSTTEAEQTLAQMNGTSWFEDLQTAQANFEAAMRERANVESQENPPRLGPARTRLQRRLDAVLLTVEVLHDYAQTQSDEESLKRAKDLIAEINELINSAMVIARARKSRDEGNRDDTEEDFAAASLDLAATAGSE